MNALFGSMTELLEVILLSVFWMVVFALLGLQFFNGAMKRRCVLPYPFETNAGDSIIIDYGGAPPPPPYKLTYPHDGDDVKIRRTTERDLSSTLSYTLSTSKGLSENNTSGTTPFWFFTQNVPSTEPHYTTYEKWIHKKGVSTVNLFSLSITFILYFLCYDFLFSMNPSYNLKAYTSIERVNEQPIRF